MIRDTLLLLDLRRQVAWNGFRRRSWARQLLLVVGLLWLGGSLGAGAAAVGYGAGRMLRRYPDLGLEPLLPGLILTLVVFLLLVTSFAAALSALFLSNDLELLMAAPVDRRAVFTSKLLDSLAFDYGILAVTGAPALVTYGLGLRFGPLYYTLALLTLLAAPLLPAAAGALLVLLVARFAPARRVREVLGLAAGLTGLACSLLGQSSRVWIQRLAGSDADPETLLIQARGLVHLPLPTLVAGQGLAAAGAGDLLGALAGLGGFLILTLGLFAGCIWAADRLYATGWVRMQSSGSARRAARAARSGGGWLARAPVTLAIALKDWRVIPRDLRNFAQMLWPLFLLPVVYFNLLSGRRGAGALAAAEQLGRGAADPAGVVIAAGILAATALLFSRLALTAISMEGKSWWLLKAAPISGGELLRGKFLAAWAPFAGLSTLLLAGAAVWRGFSAFGFLYGWYGVELLGAGMLAVGVGFAVPWARLDWEDPRRMSSGWGALFAALVWAALALVGGAFLCLPVIVEAAAPDWAATAWLGGVVAAAAFTGAVALAALGLGLIRLDAVGEA